MRPRYFVLPAIALAAASLHPAAFALSPAAARPALEGNPLLAQATTDLMGTVKYVMGTMGFAFISPDGGGGDLRVDASEVEGGVGFRDVRLDQRVKYNIERRLAAQKWSTYGRNEPS